MSVTFKIKLTCTEHPEYKGKSKNKAVTGRYGCGCYEVYHYQRKVYWATATDVRSEITEVQHNG